MLQARQDAVQTQSVHCTATNYQSQTTKKKTPLTIKFNTQVVYLSLTVIRFDFK